jgi:hypothetical protein
VDTLADVAAFCRARQEVSHKTESVPQVALLLSSVAFYDKTSNVLRAWKGEHDALHGTLHALLESGYAVDVLAEHQLEEKLDHYPIVVLPEVHTLAPAFREMLIDYVRGGGSLLVIGAETAGIFEDVLGVAFSDEAANRNDYLLIDGSMGMCEGLWQPITPQGAEVVGWRYPTWDPRKNGAPAATVTALGKGTIGAIYGPLGTVHLAYHTPQVRTFLASVVARLFPEPMVEIISPPCIDLAVRRKDGKLLIHMTNTAGMQVTSPYTIRDFIPPVGPLTLQVRLDEAPDAVDRIPEGEEALTYTWNEGLLTIHIPSLHIHSVITVE